jgi:hypothetical protein
MNGPVGRIVPCQLYEMKRISIFSTDTICRKAGCLQHSSLELLSLPYGTVCTCKTASNPGWDILRDAWKLSGMLLVTRYIAYTPLSCNARFRLDNFETEDSRGDRSTFLFRHQASKTIATSKRSNSCEPQHLPSTSQTHHSERCYNWWPWKPSIAARTDHGQLQLVACLHWIIRTLTHVKCVYECTTIECTWAHMCTKEGRGTGWYTSSL